jgi:hypothetical protein
MSNNLLPFTISGDPHGETGKCYTVHLPTVSLHFSYKTLVGIHVWGSSEGGSNRTVGAFRQPNVWGPTTAKHMRAMGLEKTTPERSEEELYEIVRGALFESVVHQPLNQGEPA